jgi:hypothetical protein
MKNPKRFRRKWSWPILRTILSFTQKNLISKGTKIFSEWKIFRWRINSDTPETRNVLPRYKPVQWCVYFCLFLHYTKHPSLQLPTNNQIKSDSWEYSTPEVKLVQIAENLNTVSFLMGRLFILDPFRNKLFLKQSWRKENKRIIFSQEY